MNTNYYFNNQIERYLLQFMKIFQGMKIKSGKTPSGEDIVIDSYIQYGSKDRVAAAILTENVQNKPMRLPAMSAHLQTINLSPERRKGIGAVRNTPYIPRGGVFPDDVRNIKQLMPIPYDIFVDLSIFTSNQNSHFQLLEQILMLFDPILQIQTSDSAFDWTKITMVKLEGINYEENYPAGTDRRMIITTLSFSIPIYISAPSNIKDDLIREIYLRLGAVNGDLQSLTDDEVLEQFDSFNLTYDLVASESFLTPK